MYFEAPTAPMAKSAITIRPTARAGGLEVLVSSVVCALGDCMIFGEELTAVFSGRTKLRPGSFWVKRLTPGRSTNLLPSFLGASETVWGDTWISVPPVV